MLPRRLRHRHPKTQICANSRHHTWPPRFSTPTPPFHIPSNLPLQPLLHPMIHPLSPTSPFPLHHPIPIPPNSSPTKSTTPAPTQKHAKTTGHFRPIPWSHFNRIPKSKIIIIHHHHHHHRHRHLHLFRDGPSLLTNPPLPPSLFYLVSSIALP